jgi:hypothetical protein
VTRLQRASLLIELITEMRQRDSWCGETSIQKATYFLERLLNVPMGFEFVLYKYGPYSFGLSEELTALRADSILAFRMRDARYGPAYVSGEMASVVVGRFPNTRERYRRQIQFVASKLGGKRVPELERLATALYVRTEKGRKDSKADAKRIKALKPHISQADAEKALKEVAQILEEAQSFLK